MTKDKFVQNILMLIVASILKSSAFVVRLGVLMTCLVVDAVVEANFLLLFSSNNLHQEQTHCRNALLRDIILEI